MAFSTHQGTPLTSGVRSLTHSSQQISSSPKQALTPELDFPVHCTTNNTPTERRAREQSQHSNGGIITAAPFNPGKPAQTPLLHTGTHKQLQEHTQSSSSALHLSPLLQKKQERVGAFLNQSLIGNEAFLFNH